MFIKIYNYAITSLGYKLHNPNQVIMNKESYNIELVLLVKENALT